jgi:hypothetical protein
MNSDSDTMTDRRGEVDASTTRRPFQFSLRTLLLGVLAASMIFSLIACYRLMPDRSSWSHGNLLSESCRRSDVPKFLQAIWGVGDDEPIVGCIIRVDVPCAHDDCPISAPATYQSFGFKYVEGIRIDKASNGFVLLVAEGAGPLHKIYLDKKLAREWFGRRNCDYKINNFVACQEFWKKYVEPELERIERESAQSGE